MADLHEGKDYFNPRLTLNQYTTTIMVAFDNFLKKLLLWPNLMYLHFLIHKEWLWTFSPLSKSRNSAVKAAAWVSQWCPAKRLYAVTHAQSNNVDDFKLSI